MPVLVLRLPPTALARFASEKIPRREPTRPRKILGSLRNRTMLTQSQKREYGQSSSDDEDDVPLMKRMRDNIVVQAGPVSRSRSACSTTVNPSLGDSNQPTTKDEVLIPSSHCGSALRVKELSPKDPLFQIRTDYNQIGASFSQLRGHFRQLGGDVKQLLDHIGQLQTQLTQLHGANQQMLTQINVLNVDKKATESETASLKGQINAMTTTNEEAMELAKTLYRTNSGLVVKNNKLEEQVRSLELQVKKSREEAEDTRQANNALRWEKVDLTTRNRKLEGDVKRLELNVEKGLDEAKHISESFDVYRKRVRNLGNEH